ncbi:acyltransferase [soil metagenome]
MASKQRLEPLTGLRFFAAVWVVFQHYKYVYMLPYGDLNPVLASIFNKGYVGVDLFFILSGFVIAYNYIDRFPKFDKTEYVSFLRARVARIYPAYFVTTAVSGLLAIVFLKEKVSPGQFLANILMLQTWLNTAGSWRFWENSLNPPSWSVSSEWLAYLVFPFFFPLFGRFKDAKKLIVAVTLLTIVSALAIHLTSKLTIVWMSQGVLRILTEFSIGVLLSQIFRAIPKPKANLSLATDLVAVATVLTVALGHLYWIAPVFGPLILLLAYGQGRLAKFLSWHPLVFLGEISYSTYLVHQIVSGGVQVLNKKKHFLDPMGQWSVIPVIILAVLVSLPLYYWWEVPMRNLLRGKRLPKVQAATPDELIPPTVQPDDQGAPNSPHGSE